jgi:hypothetical protein
VFMMLGRPIWSRLMMDFAVQDPRHDVLAVNGGLGRYPEVHRPAVEVEGDAAVLRRTGLGDVHAADHLHAHRDAGPVVLVQAAHLLEHTVDPIANAQERELGLEVDVGSPPFHRIDQ